MSWLDFVQNFVQGHGTPEVSSIARRCNQWRFSTTQNDASLTSTGMNHAYLGRSTSTSTIVAKSMRHDSRLIRRGASTSPSLVLLSRATVPSLTQLPEPRFHSIILPYVGVCLHLLLWGTSHPLGKPVERSYNYPTSTFFPLNRSM